jgi:hypothetical protein
MIFRRDAPGSPGFALGAAITSDRPQSPFVECNVRLKAFCRTDLVWQLDLSFSLESRRTVQ